MNEIYVSTDVEADGPIPGPHSMLSFASAAYAVDNHLMKLVGTFTANLASLPDAEGHPKTMEWWRKQPLAWAASRQNQQPPDIAMPRYAAWITSLPGKPVFVAYPLGFDFTFIYWYLNRFTGASPFGHNGIDIRSYAMAILKKDYLQSGKKAMPKNWFSETAHSHLALDDAIEQGALFCNMLIANQTGKPVND